MMRAGRVVRIRVNPRDCMSCVDIAQKIELYVKGMSFAQLVSVALASSLESFRQNGILPTRDGFEYTEMMRPFRDQPHMDRARKLDVTKTFALTSEKTSIPALVPESKEYKAYRSEFEELAFKHETASESMSEEERDRLRVLTNILYPDPELQQQGKSGEPTG